MLTGFTRFRNPAKRKHRNIELETTSAINSKHEMKTRRSFVHRSSKKNLKEISSQEILGNQGVLKYEGTYNEETSAMGVDENQPIYLL